MIERLGAVARIARVVVRDPNLSIPGFLATASVVESSIGIDGNMDKAFAAVGSIAAIWLYARIVTILDARRGAEARLRRIR